jgi:hypothetical protein
MQLLPSCQTSLVTLSPNGSSTPREVNLQMIANDPFGRPIDRSVVQAEVRVQGLVFAPSWRRVANAFATTLPAELFEVGGDYELLVTLVHPFVTLVNSANRSAGAIPTSRCHLLRHTLHIETAPSTHIGVLVGATAATVLLVGLASACLKRNYQRVRRALGVLIDEVSRHYISACFELVDLTFDGWVTYRVFFHGVTSRMVSNECKIAYASFLFTATFFSGIMLTAHCKILQAVCAGRRQEDGSFAPVPAQLQHLYQSELVKTKRELYWLEIVFVSMCVQNIPYTVLSAVLIVNTNSDMIVRFASNSACTAACNGSSTERFV